MKNIVAPLFAFVCFALLEGNPQTPESGVPPSVASIVQRPDEKPFPHLAGSTDRGEITSVAI